MHTHPAFATAVASVILSRNGARELTLKCFFPLAPRGRAMGALRNLDGEGSLRSTLQLPSSPVAWPREDLPGASWPRITKAQPWLVRLRRARRHEHLGSLQIGVSILMQQLDTPNESGIFST